MHSHEQTPLKVCVVGNSHITALKRYWSKVSHADFWNPTFFGANTISLKGLKSRNGILAASGKSCKNSFSRTANGLDHIVVENYDCFYLSGTLSGSNLAKMVYQIDQCHADGMPLTSQFIQDLALEFYQGSLLQRLGETFRSATDKPIFASAGPLPSEKISNSKGGLRIESGRTLAYQKLLDYFEQTISSLAAESGVQYIEYPRASRAEVLFNTHNVMIGSQALSGKTNKELPQHDLIHGNAEYGKLVFDQIVKLMPRNCDRQLLST